VVHSHFANAAPIAVHAVIAIAVITRTTMMTRSAQMQNSTATQTRISHPHPDQRHVMVTYRRYILGMKRKNGTARSLVHYGQYIQAYLAAKASVVNNG
jgi:hypothetical protein